MTGVIQPQHVWDWIGIYPILFPSNGSATVDHLIVVSSILYIRITRFPGFPEFPGFPGFSGFSGSHSFQMEVQRWITLLYTTNFSTIKSVGNSHVAWGTPHTLFF